MKIRTVLLALATLLLFACGEKQITTTVVINAENYQAAEINIAWVDSKGEFMVEGIEIVDGVGSATFNWPENIMVNLASLDERTIIEVEGGMIPGPNFTFYAEEGEVTISFDQEKWPMLTIEGGELNKDVERYWSQFAPLERESFAFRRLFVSITEDEIKPEWHGRFSAITAQKNKIQHQFIVENPNSPLSLELLATREVRYKPEEFEELFNGLDESVKESTKGRALAAKIAAKKSVSSGNPAPNFSKVDMDGKMVSLEDYKGSYLLIDFWGTWCQPCRRANPHMISLYEKYSPLGLKFLNVAQESSVKDRDKWLQAIEDDGLVWTQILNNEDIEEFDIVKLFNIKGFPTTVLIDPDGNIVNTWLGGGPDMDKKLEEIFGE